MAVIQETIDAATGLDTIYRLQVGDTFLGSLAGDDEVDRVFVPLIAGQTYTVTLTGLYGGTSSGAFGVLNIDQGQTSLTLRYADGTVFGQIPDPVVVDNGDGWSLSFVAPLSGDFSIFIDDNGDPNAGFYEVSITSPEDDDPLDTRTVEDTDNSKSWTRYTDTLNADGDVINRVLLYDDGRVQETDFVDGVRVRVEQRDLEDVRSWVTDTETFDLDGNRLERITVYDDGRVQDTDYENGARVSQSQFDTGDVRSWTSFIDTFDAGGARINRVVTYDDGRVIDTDYVDGVRAQSRQSDDGDVRSWTTLVETYDGDGVLAQSVRTDDNGLVYDTTFEDGTRAMATVTDTADIRNWAFYVDTYDEAGERVSRTTEFDDGTTRTVFDNPVVPPPVDDFVFV